MNEVLVSNIEIAQIHAKRLSYAMEKLKPYFPMTAKKVSALTDEELLFFELFTSRFAKLQDLMGTKLFDFVLRKAGANPDTMMFIDKLNRLEKIGAIESADEWRDLRDIRNHLSHEYPKKPKLTAKHLNVAYNQSTKLFKTLDTLIQILEPKI